MTNITVAIPVGSRPEHSEHLDEAVLSALSQFDKGDELLIIDDGAPLSEYYDVTAPNDKRVHIYTNPWRLGDAMSHNICVAEANNEHVLWLASDDKLLWGCLPAIKKTIEAHKKERAWYWLDVLYDNGDVQKSPSGPACVTKALWQWSGGYPPESAAGACDHLFLRCLQENGYGDVLVRVNTPVPLYWHRTHPVRERRFDLSTLPVGWTPNPWTR